MARTSGFQPGDEGSKPFRATNNKNNNENTMRIILTTLLLILSISISAHEREGVDDSHLELHKWSHVHVDHKSRDIYILNDGPIYILDEDGNRGAKIKAYHHWFHNDTGKAVIFFIPPNVNARITATTSLEYKIWQTP